MTKRKKLRHLEYYDLQDCFDNLYAKSKQGDVFTNLVEIISSEDNIRLAYRNIKRNSGSHTSGVDKLSIKNIERLSADKLVEIIQRNAYMPYWICTDQEPDVQKEKDMQVYGRRQRRNSS